MTAGIMGKWCMIVLLGVNEVETMIISNKGLMIERNIWLELSK
jgi:hypothetical protein